MFGSKAWRNLSSSYWNKLITQLSHYNSFPRPFTLLCVPPVVYHFVLKSVSYFLLQCYLLPLSHVLLPSVKPISSTNYSCLAGLDCHLYSYICTRFSLCLVQGLHILDFEPFRDRKISLSLKLVKLPQLSSLWQKQFYINE